MGSLAQQQRQLVTQNRHALTCPYRQTNLGLLYSTLSVTFYLLICFFLSQFCPSLHVSCSHCFPFPFPSVHFAFPMISAFLSCSLLLYSQLLNPYLFPFPNNSLTLSLLDLFVCSSPSPLTLQSFFSSQAPFTIRIFSFFVSLRLSLSLPTPLSLYLSFTLSPLLSLHSSIPFCPLCPKLFSSLTLSTARDHLQSHYLALHVQTMITSPALTSNKHYTANIKLSLLCFGHMMISSRHERKIPPALSLVVISHRDIRSDEDPELWPG